MKTRIRSHAAPMKPIAKIEAWGDSTVSMTLVMDCNVSEGKRLATIHRIVAAAFEGGPVRSGSRFMVLPCIHTEGARILWETMNGTEAEMTEARERLAAAAATVLS